MQSLYLSVKVRDPDRNWREYRGSPPENGEHRRACHTENAVGTNSHPATKSTGAMRYRATLTSGSLKVAESRIIAGLLLQGTQNCRSRFKIRMYSRLEARRQQKIYRGCFAPALN